VNESHELSSLVGKIHHKHSVHPNICFSKSSSISKDPHLYRIPSRDSHDWMFHRHL